MNEQLEEFRRIRERGQFAIRVIDGGHRSENAIIDLLNYTKRLEAANARHAIHHIKNICGVCGHTTTEDGCMNCFRSEIEAALTEAGAAIGNEHKPYSAAERVRQITKQRDYYTRACDGAREEMAYLEGRYLQAAKLVEQLYDPGPIPAESPTEMDQAVGDVLYQAMRIKKDGKTK